MGGKGVLQSVWHEEVDGRQVVRARSFHPGSGFRITLTFPVAGEPAHLERFKTRAIQSLHRRAGEHHGSA